MHSNADELTHFSEYEFIGQGRHRAVFRLNDKEVFKVPIGQAGTHSNLTELELFQKFGKTGGYVKYAACRMKRIKGQDVLVMEYVKQAEWSDLPDWAMSVDCAQVGYNLAGELVAYDYGS